MAISRKPKRKAPLVCSVAIGRLSRWKRWRSTGVPRGPRRYTNAAAVGRRRDGFAHSQRNPRITPAQQVAHQLRRTPLLKHLKAQRVAQFAVIFQLLYAKGHQRFLSSFDYTIRFIIVYQKMNLSSYLNGIAH